MDLKEKYKHLKDRLRVLFALSIKEKGEKGACPSVGELAAFVDGAVTPEERGALLLHLDTCPSCYNEWLAATAIMADEEQTDGAQPGSLKKDGFFRKYKASFASAVAIAASLMLLIFYNIYYQPSVASMVNSQYTMAFEYNLSLINADDLKDTDVHSNQSPGQVYGFAGSENSPPSPSAEAFIAGFQTGRIILIEKVNMFEKKEDTKTDYYWAGRWFALLSSVCESNVNIPDRFWKMQLQTMDALTGAFNRRAEDENEGVLLARSIGRINTEIGQKKRAACRSVNLELQFILEGMNIGQ